MLGWVFVGIKVGGLSGKGVKVEHVGWGFKCYGIVVNCGPFVVGLVTALVVLLWALIVIVWGRLRVLLDDAWSGRFG